jgi:hypothetical protein
MGKLNFNWSKWGFWMALTLFFITAFLWFYQTYIFEKNPKPKFEIISNEEVLILNESVSKLSIVYDNINLLEEKKNISILTFRFVNKGYNSITQNLYDSSSPLGFQILNGDLLSKPEIINSSDASYLGHIISQVINDSVIFNKLIIDKDEFVDFKCLILNRTGIKPSIKPFGKISGVKNLDVDIFTKPQGDSWWSTLIILIVSISASLLSTVVMEFVMKKIKKLFKKRTNA